jgi:hypothetical protein
MNMNQTEELTEQEINDYHTSIGADFADMSPVRVVVQGLLKSACGWYNGSTCEQILRHHKLIDGKHGELIRLTKRGKQFLWKSMKDCI